MSTTSFTKFTAQLATIGALVAVTAGVAGAQKSKPAGPPVTTHGEVKAAAPAAKGQATAEAKRTDAAADKAAKVADKKDDKADKAAAKKDEKTEASALKEARSEPKSLLKGIKLSKTEKKSVNDIQKKYDGQLKDLEKQAKASEKAGTPDATLVAKIDALRTQERADLRATLTPAQVTAFDKNVAGLGVKK
jgi:hypothetical protein